MLMLVFNFSQQPKVKRCLNIKKVICFFFNLKVYVVTRKTYRVQRTENFRRTHLTQLNIPKLLAD